MKQMGNLKGNRLKLWEKHNIQINLQEMGKVIKTHRLLAVEVPVSNLSTRSSIGAF